MFLLRHNCDLRGVLVTCCHATDATTDATTAEAQGEAGKPRPMLRMEPIDS